MLSISDREGIVAAIQCSCRGRKCGGNLGSEIVEISGQISRPRLCGDQVVSSQPGQLCAILL